MKGKRISGDEMEFFAALVHAGLFLFHALAFVFNLIRRNSIDALIHGLVCVYDLRSIRTHVRKFRSKWS